MKDITLVLEFPSNDDLPQLFGHDDHYLEEIAKNLDVKLAYRGNQLQIQGLQSQVTKAQRVLNSLLDMVAVNHKLTSQDVKDALRLVPKEDEAAQDDVTIQTRKRTIRPRSPNQRTYMESLKSKIMVFALGPAGTGKTYLAVARGVELMLEGKVDRIILSRPAVEAGERLGFLPGDLKEKVDPYLRPLYDALHDLLPLDVVQKKLTANEIEIAPLAFMRGRTLSHSFVILDEAQNTTPVQMKMFLTRIGEGSHMVINGDLSQVDLPSGTKSGLRDAMETLPGISGIDFITFTDEDVVRHPLVADIVRAYEERTRRLHGIRLRGETT